MNIDIEIKRYDADNALIIAQAMMINNKDINAILFINDNDRCIARYYLDKDNEDSYIIYKENESIEREVDEIEFISFLDLLN